MNQAQKWLADGRADCLRPHESYRMVFEDGSFAEWLPPTDDVEGHWEPSAVWKLELDKPQGVKQDSTKPRWSLLPADTISEVIDVLEFGAQKYSPGNWAHVPDARTRYYDAMMRHIESWWRGEKVDPDSGKPHLAHAVASILFLMWFDKRVD